MYQWLMTLLYFTQNFNGHFLRNAFYRMEEKRVAMHIQSFEDSKCTIFLPQCEMIDSDSLLCSKMIFFFLH